MMKYALQFAAILFTVGVLSACGTSKALTDSNESQADISWLAKSLQNEGIYVSERGSANLNVPAFESTRMLLNDREVLDVFEFEQVDDASSNAYALANMNPGRDVYQKESLVVVRYSGRDTGLSQTLHKLLGGSL